MAESIIEIQNLTRRFPGTVALDTVSLTVPQGCVFGLVGENGAGKTTLLKHLLGLLKPQSGTVSVFGRNPVHDPPGVLGRIGYLAEDHDLPAWMTVGELMSFTRAFYPAWDAGFATELLERFELSTGLKLAQLSRGQRARAALLVAVAHRPELLVLDEPSSGLDPLVRRDILDAIIRTVADEGRTVVFSSHLLDEVQRVSDRIAILNHGKLSHSSSLDDLLTSHHRFTVRFELPRNDLDELPGVLAGQGEDRDWSLVCNGQRQALEDQLQAIRAEIIDIATPSLNELFVAIVRSREPISPA